jgi:hypothetical protein
MERNVLLSWFAFQSQAESEPVSRRLLNPFDDNDEDKIRMVLNKAVQDKYNLEDCPGLVLPLVLERRKDIIHTLTKKRCPDWEDDIETTKRRHHVH